MVEVVGNGEHENLENWKSEIICKKWDEHDHVEGCGAKLSISEKDFVPRFYRGTHFRHHYIAVQCPLCGKFINAGKIPKPLLKRFWTPEHEGAATFDGVTDVY